MLRNLSIAWRASIGFGLITALTGALGLFALSVMSDMREGTRQISEDWLPGVMTLSHAAQNVQRVRALTLRMMLTSNPLALEENYAKIENLKAETRKELSAYEKTIRDPEDRAIFERFKAAEASYMQLQGKVVELTRKNQLDEAREIINGEMNQHADALSKSLSDLIEFNDRGRSIDKRRDILQGADGCDVGVGDCFANVFGAGHWVDPQHCHTAAAIGRVGKGRIHRESHHTH
jgi:methyl-accepting chemotaxis protein